MSERREFDAASCPTDGGYAEQIAILLDPSDSLTNVQRKVDSRILDRILATGRDTPTATSDTLVANIAAPETAEIQVFALDQAGRGEPAPLLRTCVPTHPDSVSRITGNPDMAERKYREFADSLRASLTRALRTPPTDSTRLIKGIQVAAVSGFQPRNSATPRQMIIVSDMLQNSGAMSFFRDEVDFGWLSGHPDYGTLRVDLTGVAVVVFQLARRGRAGRLQADGRMKQFWEDYFRDRGAQLTWVEVEG